MMKMRRCKPLWLTPLALVAVFSLGTAGAAPPGTGQPYEPAARAARAHPSKQDTGHWGERFQGRGNITETRCLGMSRGANCITAASRKDAARRAAAARAAAQEASATGTAPGGKKK
jgi:hypothetical protein